MPPLLPTRYGMGRVCLVLSLVLTATATTGAPRPITFIQPRVPIILASPHGVVIPVQLRIEPRAENRSYLIQWCDGSSAKSLDGADDSAIHPVTPLQIRVYAGTCQLRAATYNSAGRELAHVDMTLRVCGGQEECVP